MKTIINKLATLTTSKNVKDFYGFVFARMVNCSNLEELTELFRQLCTLSLSECMGEEQTVSYVVFFITLYLYFRSF